MSYLTHLSRTVVATLLLCGPLVAGEITIKAPGEPLEVKEHAILPVSGIPESALASASVDLSPSEGVTLIAAKSWTGEPFLLFQARKPGKYTITISLNGWIDGLEASTAQAEAALGSDILAVQLRTLVNRLILTYPLSKGSCLVEVAGEDDSPPIPPPVPVPVPGEKWMIIFRESSDQTAKQAKTFLELREKLEANDHTLLVMDPDQAEPKTVLRAYLDLLEGELPGVCLADAAGKVLYSGSLPDNLNDILQLVGE